MDDELDQHAWMKVALEAAGHEVRTALDARRAMRIVESWHPDLVVTDILMPETDGLTFASDLQLRYGVHTLVISVVQREAEAVIAGASGYLRKPTTAGDLRRAVGDILGDAARDVTILVVDDDDDIRATYRLILEPRFKVIEAENGLRALDRLKESKVALLITDVHMPLMDGRELVRSVRADPTLRTLPIVVQTQDPAAAREPLWRSLDVSRALTKDEYLGWLLQNVEREIKSSATPVPARLSLHH
ncbi:MAG: response regulator [Polyangiales bacterium]